MATATKGKSGKANNGKANNETKVSRSRTTSNGLTPKMVEALERLNKRPATKGELWEELKVGSGALGAGTKDNPEGLLGMGFVRCEKHEGERQLQYVITKTGKVALEKARKELAARE